MSEQRGALGDDKAAGLRDTIAHVLWDTQRYNAMSQDDYYDQADAVLDALGLEQVGWMDASGFFASDVNDPEEMEAGGWNRLYRLGVARG